MIKTGLSPSQENNTKFLHLSLKQNGAWLLVLMSNKYTFETRIYIYTRIHTYIYTSSLKNKNAIFVQSHHGPQAFPVCYSLLHICGTIDGLVVESNWLLQRITVNSPLEKNEFSKWMLSSLKTRLWTTYLHCRSMSLMFLKLKPNQISAPFFYYYRFGAFHCKRAEACSVYSVSLVSSG